MTNPTNNSEDVLKKLSRRNWLGNAAIAVAGAVVLIFIGCTKEKWDNVKGHVPGGGVGSQQDTLYQLKLTYRDQYGQRLRDQYIGLYWQYIAVDRSAEKFKLYPGKNGFYYLQSTGNGWRSGNGDWLSLKYNGWAYHSDEDNRVGWKIVDGKLYSDYSRWKDYPLSCQWGSTIFGFESYYAGVNLGDDNVLTDCELVRVQ